MLAIYFHGLKGRNPNHEQKQNQITKERARDTHPSHSSIPLENTLRIINCTNRIISISKKIVCLFGKICFFFKIFHYEFPKNGVWERPYGTVLEKLWPLANIDMSLREKNINSVLRGFDQNKIYGKFFPRWERGIRFFKRAQEENELISCSGAVAFGRFITNVFFLDEIVLGIESPV